MTANVNTDSEQMHIVYRHADGTAMQASDWLPELNALRAAVAGSGYGMAEDDADLFIHQFLHVPYEDEV